MIQYRFIIFFFRYQDDPIVLMAQIFGDHIIDNCKFSYNKNIDAV